MEGVDESLQVIHVSLVRAEVEVWVPSWEHRIVVFEGHDFGSVELNAGIGVESSEVFNVVIEHTEVAPVSAVGIFSSELSKFTKV